MLADQDSNLDKQNQNLLCYRYTIGQRTSLLTRASILWATGIARHRDTDHTLAVRTPGSP